MSSDADYRFIRQVRAAQGYLELGMAEDAMGELNTLEAGYQKRIEVTLLRMEILRLMEKWEAGAALGEAALQDTSDCGPLYLITAYAVRRHLGLERARAVLLSGESILAGEAMFHFNIACYECQMGDIDSAKMRLERAFQLDAKYRQVGSEDPDLKHLWEWISAKTDPAKKGGGNHFSGEVSP